MDTEKHTRYLSHYQPNDYFWGIGIENETYIQFLKMFAHPTTGIHQHHRPERYSVNYYVGLQPEYKEHVKALFPTNKTHYQIPIFMNSHTLQKTDISGNHQTTYEKEPKPNPEYKGKSLHEVLCIHNPDIFAKKYKLDYTFDGDTIEFMTQNYYKCTAEDSIEELIEEKQLFLNALNTAFKELNVFQEYGPLLYPARNEPFVSYLTNPKNIAIFNNGTYHINITLPTQLGSDAEPIDGTRFVQTHKTLIRFIQVLEPFLIIKYGTPDPFSQVSPKYSAGSQRCAVSRYIGIGTYDTDIMLTGKILNAPIESFPQSKLEYWWYKKYNETSNYIPLPKIGVDINFRKHGVHGIEIRFLEWFPESRLPELFETLIHLCDYSLQHENIENPILDPIWNNFVVRSLQQGAKLRLENDELEYFSKIFGCIDLNTDTNNILDVYKIIDGFLLKTIGKCVHLMLRKDEF